MPRKHTVPGEERTIEMDSAVGETEGARWLSCMESLRRGIGKTAMRAIECITLSGQSKQIPTEMLSFRPAAYAILIRNQKILLVKMEAAAKYHLPGGGIEETLRREVLEETGIHIQVDRLAHFEELFL